MRPSRLPALLVVVTALACAGPTTDGPDDAPDDGTPQDPDLDVAGGSSTGGARDANAIPPTVYLNAGIGGNTERAQTFRVSRGGLLTGVSVWIKRFTEGQDLTVDVRPAAILDEREGLVPVESNDEALATAVVPWSRVEDEIRWIDVPFPEGTFVVAGDTLGITLRASEIQDFHYGWMGGEADLYPDGGPCERATDNHPWGCGQVDFGFSVWIDDSVEDTDPGDPPA